MRHPHSMRFCISCNRSLPRAARRCPWCKRLSGEYAVLPLTLRGHEQPERRRDHVGERS
jgi:hypothetical protein